uniref:Putative ovule protein n=1 Tax=Solanum chacoense TaxID=4108 RepID=A0A0V0IH11_SOLCH
MKGCLFLGEFPVWLAEMDVGDHVGDLSAIKKWLDDLFMSYGFRVKMIEYDEVARNLRQDSAKRVSEVSTSILFVAEHLRFSDDQMETWRTEFQRIEEEGDEEGFEEL